MLDGCCFPRTSARLWAVENASFQGRQMIACAKATLIDASSLWGHSDCLFLLTGLSQSIRSTQQKARSLKGNTRVLRDFRKLLGLCVCMMYSPASLGYLAFMMTPLCSIFDKATVSYRRYESGMVVLFCLYLTPSLSFLSFVICWAAWLLPIPEEGF